MNYYFKALQNYATFSGRARRSEYWYFVLFNIIISILISVIGAAMHMKFLSNIYSILVLLPGLAVGVRRMHDVGRSGWYLLIPIYSLILCCEEGMKGENDYGPDPKEESNEESAVDA